MRRIDYHLHTYHSADSKAKPEEHILKAIEEGLEEICFTDHHDCLDGWRLKYEPYFEELLPLKEKYKDQIKVKIGIEIGIDMDGLEESNTTALNGPYDFVIGSIHSINLQDITQNSFYGTMTKDEAHANYFKVMLNCVKNIDNFDVLGHLDYARRYGPYEDKTIDYAKHQDIIDEVFRTLIAKGKGIEINLSGIRHFGQSLPGYDQLKRYYDLGGRIITIGTDSHDTEFVGMHVDKAIEMLTEIGFEDVTTFTQRKKD